MERPIQTNLPISYYNDNSYMYSSTDYSILGKSYIMKICNLEIKDWKDKRTNYKDKLKQI